MLCAVSLNPALDKYLRLPRIAAGRHQQASEVVTSAGGKAINCAGVIRALGEDVVVLGFFGGYTGDFILSELSREGVVVAPVRVRTPTRTAFVIVEEGGTETEIVEPGAVVAPAELAALREHLRELARSAAVVLLSGSVPPGCPADIYQTLIADVGDHCPALLDTSREWLRAVVEAPGGAPRPRAVKPNRLEAEELLGRRLETSGDFAAALDSLRARGVEQPLISNGEDGLFAASGGERRRAFAPPVERVNSVGSGDAALAGYAVALARGLNFEDRLRLAVACGTANVLTKECAQVRPPDVERLLREIQVEEV